MNKRDRQFIQTVLAYHTQHGRHSLPWRKTTNPYYILVSEVMLQQTQVTRVIQKYQAFLTAFPSAQKLAEASLGEVLTLWQGLGYNRRAKLLQSCAKAIVDEHQNCWPKTFAEIKALPGIGPYTAGAIMAFAYNQGVPLIETNVRTVYLHHWFAGQSDVSDRNILTLVAKHLVGQSARTWYAALMDYGSYLKHTYGNPNSRAKAYVTQSAFAGSDRQIRGAIIRLLSATPVTRVKLLQSLSQFEDIKVDVQLEKLVTEGMVAKTKHTYHLPT